MSVAAIRWSGAALAACLLLCGAMAAAQETNGTNAADAQAAVARARVLLAAGDKAGARGAIAGIASDTTPDLGVIKAAVEADDLAKARALTDAAAGRDKKYLAAGDKLQAAGVYPMAQYAYTMAMAVGRGSAEPAVRQARQALARLFAGPFAPDLARIPDGVYRGTCRGYVGPVIVNVTVKGGRIASIAVQQRESRPRDAVTEVPRRLVEKQGLKDVDAVTGATITSHAIKNATAAALKDAEK